MRALVVEDDVDLLDLTTYALRREGYEVLPAVDGPHGLQRWKADAPDIILLDANLPRLNGFEVCRRIRQESETPIIMVTARDDDEDVVRGLQLGADDYVTKPFSAKQLAARMRAILRRAAVDHFDQPVNAVEAGDLRLEMNSHEATRGDEDIALTALEFRIAFMLVANAGRVVPYMRLVEYAWGYDAGDPALLKTHVCHIREKLGMPLDRKSGIKPVPGVGYKLVV